MHTLIFQHWHFCSRCTQKGHFKFKISADFTKIHDRYYKKAVYVCRRRCGSILPKCKHINPQQDKI